MIDKAFLDSLKTPLKHGAAVAAGVGLLVGIVSMMTSMPEGNDVSPLISIAYYALLSVGFVAVSPLLILLSFLVVPYTLLFPVAALLLARVLYSAEGMAAQLRDRLLALLFAVMFLGIAGVGLASGKISA